MTKRVLALALLLLFFCTVLVGSVGDSPTMDEQNHIARGLAYLRTGDPRLSLEHPPLVNALSALPLLTQPVRLPTDDWSWRAGEWYRFADQLLWHVNPDADRIVFLARLPIMFLATLLASLLFRVVRTWAGRGAALVALALYCFDPNIVAHSQYSTTDLGVTAFLFLAAAALWWAGRDGYQPGQVMLAGAAYGLALSAKYSALAFCPVFLLLALGRLVTLKKMRDRSGLVAAGLRVGLLYPMAALLAVWAVYGFDWGALVEGGPAVPMPLFWRGMGAVFDLSGGGRPAFLLGRFSTKGFWAYFPAAFVIKTPLPTLLLLALALCTLGARVKQAVSCARRGDPGTARDSSGGALCLSAYLLLPALVYFAVSMGSALNLGYRHLLPILPFLFAFVGYHVPRTGVSGFVVTTLLLWLVVGGILVFPHYLSYFNEIVGPSGGYRVLVDSNVDWGQDLKRLKSWMDGNGVERVKLAWFGSAYPNYYGIAYDPLPGLPHHFDLWERPPFDPTDPEPGVYAISVSILQELHRRDEDKTVFAWFREQEPDDRVGYSVLIFRVAAP